MPTKKQQAAVAEVGDSDVSMNEGSLVAGGPDEEETLEGEVLEEDAPLQELSPVAQEMALAIREERGLAVAPTSSLPTPTEWAAMIAFAAEIARTQFVPASYRGQPEAVIAAIQTGRELGIGPMQSLRDIHMIDGRPAFAATLMLSMMRRGGVEILNYEVNDERAFIHARRRDTGEEAEVEWTYEEASKIQRGSKRLVDGDGWKNYRQDMLWARCVGRLSRRLGSDLLAGMVYSSEELKDLEAGTGDYSATTRAPALNWQTLKPGEQLWPKAPQGWGQIMERLVALDAGLDWKELVARIWHEAYEVSSVAELGDRAQVAGRRLANLTAYLEEVVMEGREFPPPSDEELVAAIGWAFDGIVVAIPEPDPAALEAAQAKLAEAAQTAADLEQIEFGDAAAEPEEPAAS